MGILLSFIFIFCGWAAQAKPTNLPQIEFLDTAECNSDQRAIPACREFTEGGFADWDRQSIATVNAAVDKMPAQKLGRILDLIHQRGVNKIGFIKKTDGLEVAATAVRDGVAYIVVNKEFFSSRLNIGDTSEQTHALIHELIHVYIYYYIGNVYYSSEFWTGLMSALEWSYPKGLNSLVDAKERAQHVKERNRLRDSGQFELAIAEDLGYARSRGFPSLYSMTQISEYLCELVAYLIHDPTTERALPATVTNWLGKSDLAFLLDSQISNDEFAQMSERRPDVEGKFDFVGIFYVLDRPTCTVTILQHGFLRLARHCLESSWFSDFAKQTKHSFLSVAFYPAKGGVVRIEGSSMTIMGDPGDDDLAYVRYPAELTSQAISLPVFELVTDPNTPLQGALFTVGYPMPEKAQRLQRMISGPCHFDGRKGELPGYLGLLVGTTCPAWYGSSGSLIFAEITPGHLQVWGAISHTFSSDKEGKPLPSAIKRDAWGKYTDSNFSPLWLSTVRF